MVFNDFAVGELHIANFGTKGHKFARKRLAETLDIWRCAVLLSITDVTEEAVALHRAMPPLV